MIGRVIRCERGNSLVELGFIAPILATFVIGTIDLSTAYSAELALEQAAQRTIERVQVKSYETTQKTALENEAKAAAGGGASATVTAWLECNGNGIRLDFDTGTCNEGDPYARYVELDMQQSFTPMFGEFFPGGGTITLDATAGVRVQ